MVEVGSADPEFLSQSKFFRDLGWRCICIEPNPKFVKRHLEVGNEIYEYACSNFNQDDVKFELVNLSNGLISNESFSSLTVDEEVVQYSGYTEGKSNLNIECINVNVRTLTFILDESKTKTVDYIIVDVEGKELDVIDGLDLNRYHPKVIVLENNIPSRMNSYNSFMKDKGFVFQEISDGNNYVHLNKTYE
jgi:FkbM family methyltransferase